MTTQNDGQHNTLRQTIDVWLPKLRLITEEQANQVVGSKWTRKQLIGHLIDSAANNHQRFIRLQQGDLSGFPGYDQEQWVDKGHYSYNTWSNIIQLWYLYNQQLALVIEHVDVRQLHATWTDKKADLQFLMEDYVAHLSHHLERVV